MREPVLARYRCTASRICFRAGAAFSNPEVYALLAAKEIRHAIRSPANRVQQDRMGHLFRRPVVVR